MKALSRRTGRKRRPAPVTVPHVMKEVDNPHYSRAHDGDRSNPKRIKAAYNPRESYVGLLHQRGKISDSERRAGDKVRQAFEMMGGVGAQAMDYTREPVDGGGIPDPITDRQLRAGRTLREVHDVLGPAGHDLVIRIAGEGRWPRDLTSDQERQRYLSLRLRECLEHLAVHWGYQVRRIVAVRA